MVHNVKANSCINYTIRFPMNIGVGKYSVSTALVQGDSHVGSCYEWRDYAYMFEVKNYNKNSFIGSAWLNASVDVKRK